MGEESTRLLAATHWAPQGSAIESMLGLRAGLLRRAGEQDVRTALLYAAGWLVEWVEGPADAVDAAWAQARAQSARLLHRSAGPRSLVQPVQLASLHTGEKPTDVARRLHLLAREHEEGWRADPAEVWQALGAPCQLGGLPLAAAARRDVLALASDENAAVDVLRLLAQSARLPVAYQRFAGSDLQRGDVGAAYVDAPVGNTVVRVQALSRRALGQEVALLGLRNVVRTIVLLGNDGPRGQALLEELQRLLVTLDRAIEVDVLSQSASAHAAASRLLGTRPGVRVHAWHAAPTAHGALQRVTGWLEEASRAAPEGAREAALDCAPQD